jgi:RNA polymerase sigma-70 factor (ECF subfamily)
MNATPETVTRLLAAARLGDRNALDELMPIVFDELHRIASGYMRRERAGHTLQPTALVNEVYLKLVADSGVEWQGRAHFVGVAARLMRNILVDHARARGAAKRNAGERVSIAEVDGAVEARDVDLLALDEALERLAALDADLARVVELRYFGGLTTRETAEALGVSTATVEREWATARGWLRRELERGSAR